MRRVSPAFLSIFKGKNGLRNIILRSFVISCAVSRNFAANVTNVIYGDPDYAMVSEIALVSGVDKVVSVTNTGIGTFNFKEVIAAQVCSFVAALYSASMNNEGFEIVLDVGATEPLFKLK